MVAAAGGRMGKKMEGAQIWSGNDFMGRLGGRPSNGQQHHPIIGVRAACISALPNRRRKKRYSANMWPGTKQEIAASISRKKILYDLRI
jgi:hypothetical protein